MSHQSELIERDIDAYLKQHEHKEILRFLTCGSVDDGKSTLIGRLLHDSKMIYEDQLAAIHRDSERAGSAGEELDLSLLMDGLKAEREQGITIDVAYRFFSTAKRKFIIADTPGHEQYTRNMVTGASTADLAVILIDAKQGVLPQTRRHSFIASLLGIKHVVVAVNKMDLVDWSEDRYEEIKREYNEFIARLDIADLHFIPMSALKGDNVVDQSPHMPWYRGAPLMEHLESVQISSDRNLVDLRFPVQYVNRPDHTFRGYCGNVVSGVVRTGDEVMVLPSRTRSRIARIVTADGDIDQAYPPLAPTLVLEDELDISRGDMLVHPGNVPKVANELDAMVVWMADDPMVEGRDYWVMQSGSRCVGNTSNIRYRVDVNTLRRQQTPRLSLNEIGRCKLALNRPIAHDAYRRNRATGSFILVDRMTNLTVGAGMILDRKSADAEDRSGRAPADAALARVPVSKVSPEERAARYQHAPVTVLLTGLPASGKTTIALELEQLMFEAGWAVALLDGQAMRVGLSRDLGYSAPERVENLRRGMDAAKLMNDAGFSCICAFTSPDARARARARATVAPATLVEVFVDTPLEVCQARDEKEIYARAERGEIPMLPGLTGTYDRPEQPDLHVTTERTAREVAEEILSFISGGRGASNN
jgi:bifunctional enzyme CysN/CysC